MDSTLRASSDGVNAEEVILAQTIITEQERVKYEELGDQMEIPESLYVDTLELENEKHITPRHRQIGHQTMSCLGLRYQRVCSLTTPCLNRKISDELIDEGVGHARKVSM